MRKEVWKKITGYIGYEVSSLGQIRCLYARGRGKYLQTKRLDVPRIIPQSIDDNGYPVVSLTRKNLDKDYTFGKNESINFFVHILVAAAFLVDLDGIEIQYLRRFIKEETGEFIEVHHKDYDPGNAAASNLCWITRSKHRELHKNPVKIQRKSENIVFMKKFKKFTKTEKDKKRFFTELRKISA